MKAIVIKVRPCSEGWTLFCINCCKSHVEKQLSGAIKRARKHGNRCNGRANRKTHCNCAECRRDRKRTADKLMNSTNGIVVVYR